VPLCLLVDRQCRGELLTGDITLAAVEAFALLHGARDADADRWCVLHHNHRLHFVGTASRQPLLLRMQPDGMTRPRDLTDMFP